MFDFVERIRERLAQRGVLWALRAAAQRMRRILSLMHWRQRHYERRFDAERAIDTAGTVILDRLSITSANRKYGISYSAVDPRHFYLYIDELIDLGLHLEDFSFIDFGAGKGRALILASEFPFRRVIGVEFAEELCTIARRNIAISNTSSRSNEVSIICQDAADFVLPDEPLVLFFYNPFGVEVMRHILDKVRNGGHPVYLLVIGEALQAFVHEAGFRTIPRPMLERRKAQLSTL